MKVEEAVELLKNNGYKYTGKRVEMLDFFASHDRYLSAKDVFEGLKDRYPNLSFDTIYRNLALFSELGILESTDLSGEKHFRITCMKNEHHHHFICLKCGRTREIEVCPMRQIAGELDGYQISGHKFEVYGYCNQCAG